ncbi:MAG TPA: urate oxidase [Actinomycetes bacterium]|nr:urate oxidase [Actinomycetes bacterium]
MAIVLGPNQYGKAETHLVRVYRDTDRHEIRDLTVSTSLRGDFTDAHRLGDQAHVLPTDSQKNTVLAFAKERGVGQIEDFALALARHFVDDVEAVETARVDVDEHSWERIEVDGRPHDHAFVRGGAQTRTATAVASGRGEDARVWVVTGLKDLALLKSTGSEFAGFATDRFTTLAETHDRVLATSLTARWRHGSTTLGAAGGPAVDWAGSFAAVRSTLLATYARVHSLAMQQTLWEMGKAVLELCPDVVEVRLSAPNKHHFLVDLAPFGLDNPGEVFFAADRPYGLIQASALRDDAPDPGPVWAEAPSAFV